MSRYPDYVADILQMMNRVQTYIEDMDKDAFLADLRTQNAVCRCIEISAEAAKRLSAGFRTMHNYIAWQDIAGMGDVLLPAYDLVDLDLVWEAAVTSIPRLKPRSKSWLAIPLLQRDG